MFTIRTKAFASVACAAALLVSLFAFALASPPDATPTAEQVLDRFVEALGGVKAFDKLTSTVTKATLAIPAMGVTIDVTIYAARPNKFYSLAESAMIGKIERGTDGSIFWEKSTMQGPRVLEGEELADAMRDAKFEGLAYWRSLYDSVAVSGLDTVDGSPAYAVVLKPKDGKPRTYVFDVTSGLLVKTINLAVTQMGEIPVVGYVTDYRRDGELLQSYKTTMKVMGQDRVITVSGIERNVAIPDSVFALPADVKEILEAAKEEKKE
ncbi:MAG: hypothetical protein C4574_05575 [Candidatus Latescibacterota bacterium]|jgi:hypothetical protein|nr:MAG: hypothetical protein C4574_05575 [Candidatus Latescibacterota bacterium]